MEKKLLFIVNPRSGKNKPRGPLYDAVAEFCRGGYLVSVHETAGTGDATRCVLEHGGDYDLVVCCGGDGTLNETVNGLMQLPEMPPLGYIPAGSTNDFATSLGLPGDIRQAAAAIMKGKPRQLDLGRFNQRYFSYVASFGAFTQASYATPQSAKNVLGHLAYLLAGIKDISSLRPHPVELLADGELISGKFLFGAISNSTSIGGLLRLPDRQVQMDDGKLELLLVRCPDNLIELQELVGSLLMQDFNSRWLSLHHVSRAVVYPQEEMEWSLDGEREPGAAMITVENLPGRLKIIV